MAQLIFSWDKFSGRLHSFAPCLEGQLDPQFEPQLGADIFLTNQVKTGGTLRDFARLHSPPEWKLSASELPTEVGAVFSIGRTPTSTLKLIDDSVTEPRVHRDHATITLTASGAYELKLIGKGQSTFVNEIPLYHVALPWQTYVQPPVQAGG